MPWINVFVILLVHAEIGMVENSRHRDAVAVRCGRYSTATRLEQQASFCAFDLDKTAHIYKGKIETFIVGNQNRW